MKNLPLSSAINNQLSGYYGSLADSETVLNGIDDRWLDLSPFVSYMLDAFERCLIDAALSVNALTEAESKLLERMNKAGIHAEITTNKAAGIFPLAKTADPIADQRKKDPSTACPHLLKRKRILVFAATAHFPVHFRYKIQPLPPLHFHFRDHLQRSAA